MNPIKKIVAAVKRVMGTNSLKDIPDSEKEAYLALQQHEQNVINIVNQQY